MDHTHTPTHNWKPYISCMRDGIWKRARGD
jgi:hypothetical protein